MNENSKYITLAVNEKQQLVGETDTVWESSDPSVVSVSPEGIVRGNAPGVATVSAASIGGDGVQKDVTVTIKDGGGGSTGGTGSGTANGCCPDTTTENEGTQEQDGETAPTDCCPDTDTTTENEGTQEQDGETAPTGCCPDTDTTTENEGTQKPEEETETPSADEIEDASNNFCDTCKDCCTCCDCDCDSCCCCCPEDTEVPVQCIQVSPSSLTLSVGESASLGATVYPKNATDKGVEWSSGNSDVAAVNPSGIVVATGVGRTSIIADAVDGSRKRGGCTVVVKATESIKIVGPSRLLNVGEVVCLSINEFPEGTKFRSVSWSSDNSTIVSVSAEGCITAKSGGDTTIRAVATTMDGKKLKESCSVSVRQATTSSTEGTQNPKVNGTETADPVDLYSGAHVIKNTVMTLFGGQGLKLIAHYNSTQLTCGVLGSGWYHNFEKHVEVACDEARVYSSPSSYSVYEKDSGDSSKFHCKNVLKTGYVLTVDCSQQYPYVIDCNKERTEYYNADGILVKIVDHQGFETQIAYTDACITIKDSVTGKRMHLEKNASGNVARVYDDTGRQAAFTYSGGYLTSIQDVNGNSLTFTYNEEGQVLTGTDGKGIRYFENTYDESGRVVMQKDGVNGSLKTIFEYNGDKRIITDRNGNTSIRQYDCDGLLIDFTDENGNTISYAYDEHNNVVCEKDGAGNYVGKTYNGMNKPTEITDKNGNTTYLTYDAAGNVTKIRYPDVDGAVCEETFRFNARNQIVEHTDLRGTTTKYTYDANGMPKSKKIGNNPAEQYIYENGLLKSVTDPRGNTTTFTYNARGLLTARTDADGKTTSYTYNASGDLIQTTDASGKTVTTVYDCNHQKTSVTDEGGNRTEYSYNGNMKNTVVTMPDGGKIRYAYDGEDRPTQITDQANNVTVMQYDKGGRLITKRHPDGGTVQYEYDGAGRVTKEINPKGAATVKTYDKMGNVLTVKDHAGNITTYQYNAMGKVTRVANAAAGTTTYTYSKAGDLLTETDALGNVKTYTYDAYGNRLTATDAKGNTTTYTYDEMGNLLTATDALHHTTTYTYDCLNRLVSVKDAKGNTTAYEYDALGRRTKTTDPKGNVFTTLYDGCGNVVKTTDAKGNTVSETTYNCLNLPATVVDAAGKTTTYTYTPLGKVATVTDGMNHTSQYTYDARGRNTKVTDAAGGNSTAAYDVMGNLTRLAGPLGGATNYTYDEMGRLIAESTVSGGTVAYTYNALNLKAQLTNARGQSRTYAYDAMGRITGCVTPEDTVSYTYDANGNVLTVTDSHGVITRTYDALNRVTALTDVYGKTIRYEYDEVGNLTRLTYPDNTAVTYAYDANHNLTTVTDWANRVTSYTYDENNRVIGVSKPDGSITATTYDSKQRVTSTVERTASGTVITGFEYTYDELSRIVEEKYLANSTKLCYTYDNLNRVTKRTVKNLSDTVLSEENYSYDAAGNITDAPDSCFAYDTNNRLTWYNGDAVSYDADGNMLSVVLNGTTGTTFTYDSANRLISAGGHTYTYNAEDVRIRNLCAGEDTKYTYNTNCRLSKLLWKETNGTVTKYVYGRGLIGEETNSSFTTYHFDCRGSTVALTNANGVITDTFEYDTYGGLISRTGNSNVIFLYNGRDGVVTDTNGLIYMRARYYSPDMRRFVNADIVAGAISEAVTLNRFAYANGNPVSNIDPFGLSVETKDGDDGWLSGLKNWWNDTVDTVSEWWDDTTDKVSDWWHDAANEVGEWLDSVDWTKVVEGALLITVGTLTVTAVVVSGGTCSFVVAAGYAALGTAGVVATTIGYSEMEEGFSGTNELKEYIGSDAYDALLYGSITVISYGSAILGYGLTETTCFVAGTPVLTENGNVPIETIAAGDMVWAEDPETGEKGLKRVVQTFVNETSELVHVHVNGEEIVSTPTHPYYVVSKGWISAVNLQEGDVLVLQNGEKTVVDAVETETLDIPVKVYNFEVEEFHTYYVSDSSVLVHNKCGNDYKPLTSNNYRSNSLKYHGVSGNDVQVHHMLPQQYESLFASRGINIHSPIYTRPMTTTSHVDLHRSGYNAEWGTFFQNNPNFKYDDIMNMMRELNGLP